MIVHWFGFIEHRHSHDLCVWQQVQQRHRTVAKIDPISNVRPKPDEHSFSSHFPLLSTPRMIVVHQESRSRGVEVRGDCARRSHPPNPERAETRSCPKRAQLYRARSASKPLASTSRLTSRTLPF